MALDTSLEKFFNGLSRDDFAAKSKKQSNAKATAYQNLTGI